MAGDLDLGVGPFIFHCMKNLSKYTSVLACSTVHIWQMAFIYFKDGNMTNAQKCFHNSMIFLQAEDSIATGKVLLVLQQF